VRRGRDVETRDHETRTFRCPAGCSRKTHPTAGVGIKKGVQMDQRHMQLSWHRSTRCSSGGCVEMASTSDAVLIRDSKQTGGEILAFDPQAWKAFVADVITNKIGS
jgi:uncharacterized protein DUF397